MPTNPLRLLAAAALAAGLFIGARMAIGQDEPAPQDLRPAMRAAEAWLETVDSGRYGVSWDAASTIFQDAIPRLRWEATVQGIRESLGPVIARKLRSATYATVLPGAPEGEYVVIQFNTQFDKRPLSVETVTPMLQKDGSWKVSGYVIR